MQLSEHFTLAELTKSSTAKQLGIDNTPNAATIVTLTRLCQNLLEPIRKGLGYPIVVNSGYRCPKLNKAVGGSATSQHMNGEAVDIVCKHTTNAELFRLIEHMMRSGEILVGQLIWEYGDAGNPAWVHLSLPRPNKPNGQIIYLHN